MKVTLARSPQATIEVRYVGHNGRDTFAPTSIRGLIGGSFEPVKSEDGDSVRVKLDQGDTTLSFERADQPGQRATLDLASDLVTLFGDCFQHEVGAGLRGFTVEVAEISSSGRKVLLSKTCREGSDSPDFDEYYLASKGHWGGRFFIFFAMPGTPSASAGDGTGAVAKKTAAKLSKKAKKSGGQ